MELLQLVILPVLLIRDIIRCTCGETQCDYDCCYANNDSQQNDQYIQNNKNDQCFHNYPFDGCLDNDSRMCPNKDIEVIRSNNIYNIPDNQIMERM
jgi:hypothetical protein